jgi:transcriptional regulator with XRE-family HTH domain
MAEAALWQDGEMMRMTPGQCRTARALLGWPQDKLAKAAKLSTSTIYDFERDRRKMPPETIQAIRLALENAGVLFVEGGGATLRRRPK